MVVWLCLMVFTTIRWIKNKLEAHFLANLTKSLAKPKHILMNLKGKCKDTLTNIKQVYNARQYINGQSEMKSQRCNVWSQIWRSVHIFISQEQNVSLLLLKTCFGFIPNLLSCLTFFRQFWSCTPPIKPTCI